MWFISDQISHSVASDSLRPHESQHTRHPCPSPTPRVHWDSGPSSQWCQPAISSSVVTFSSCPQSLPASESYPMNQLFAWGGQSTGVSASASFPLKKSQGWSPEWTGWISLQSKGLSRVFSNTTVQKHQFISTQLSLWSNSHPYMTTGKTIALTRQTSCLLRWEEKCCAVPFGVVAFVVAKSCPLWSTDRSFYKKQNSTLNQSGLTLCWSDRRPPQVVIALLSFSRLSCCRSVPSSVKPWVSTAWNLPTWAGRGATTRTVWPPAGQWTSQPHSDRVRAFLTRLVWWVIELMLESTPDSPRTTVSSTPLLAALNTPSDHQVCALCSSGLYDPSKQPRLLQLSRQSLKT